VGRRDSCARPEEIERGYSISLGCAHAEWMDTKINLIDTPGYADFQGDAIAGLAAADGALVVISATGGVEVGNESMFREALEKGRCLIPATGFFEWRALAPKQRQPMHIQLKDGAVFAFAGLWLPPAKRGGLPSAAIITTRPNELMATIHTRMPAILLPEHEQAWLDPSAIDPMQLLGPYPAELMHAYPVSALVNSWENESPAVLAPTPLPLIEIQATLPE